MNRNELYRDHLERLLELFQQRDIISMDELCDYLHMDRRTILKDKKCPAKKIAGKYVVPLVNLARYLAQ